MFEREKRYITCGIDQRLPQDLQRLIWTSVDARILFSNEKIDYLQVFTFKKLDEEILCFDRVFHVWNGDQWVYCGKSEKEAQAAFLKLVRIRDTGCTNSRFVS